MNARILLSLRRAATAALPCLLALCAGGAGAADGDGAAAVPAPAGEFKVPPPLSKDRPPLFVPMEYPMPGSPAAGTYQMRCWQRGRLLFAESNLSEPVVAAMPGKIAAFSDKGTRLADAQSASTYLVEVADSLCLIKRK